MQVLDKGYVELIAWMGNDNTVVSAARVSHLGETKGKQKDEELISYLMEHKHTSPFEQVEFQFRIKCPIFVARQWMRHRTWSYNEQSRRYTSENIEFYIPEQLHGQSTINRQAAAEPFTSFAAQKMIDRMAQHFAASLELYEALIITGVSREEARIVLPVSMYTTFYGKVNLHNLFHFLNLRNSPEAQTEIRLYAQAIESLIEPIVPVSFSNWRKFNLK